jgi:endo-1,4-beta-D-glucanase Y
MDPRNYPYALNCCYGDYKIAPDFFLKTLDKSRDLTYTLCIMGIRAPIYIGLLSQDKREKNSLKNRVE